MSVVGVVVVHLSPVFPCFVFDVVVKVDKVDVFKWLRSKLYTVDCPVVKKVLRYLSDFVYIGSEDLCHLDAVRDEVVVELMNELLTKFNFVDVVFYTPNPSTEEVEDALRKRGLLN